MRFRFLLPLLVIVTCSVFSSVNAQTVNRSDGVAAYKAGNYSKAIDLLKKAVKENANDAAAWNMLGSAYLGKGKNKDGVKALEKAVKIDPKDPAYLVGLAFGYMVTRDNRANAKAREVLVLDPKNADAHFILGQVALLDGSYNVAYERAQKVVGLNPAYASAYRLKGQALLASFAAQGGTVIKPPANRYDMLNEASEAFEKYLSLITDENRRAEMRDDVESLKNFAIYFSKTENRGPLDLDAPPDPAKTPLAITSKPRPSYTDSARSNMISGTAVLLVEFKADGRIGGILIVRSLDDSLDREAVRAARAIKFKPPTKNGVAVGTVRTVEYSFSIF